jgi:hypothetical protein
MDYLSPTIQKQSAELVQIVFVFIKGLAGDYPGVES